MSTISGPGPGQSQAPGTQSRHFTRVAGSLSLEPSPAASQGKHEQEAGIRSGARDSNPDPLVQVVGIPCDTSTAGQMPTPEGFLTASNNKKQISSPGGSLCVHMYIHVCV